MNKRGERLEVQNYEVKFQDSGNHFTIEDKEDGFYLGKWKLAKDSPTIKWIHVSNGKDITWNAVVIRI